MNISKFLGKVAGIYLVILGSAMLISMPQFLMRFNNLVENDLVLLVTGIFTLIIGLLMVVSHNVWELSWRVIITILAWAIFLRGATIVLYPQLIVKYTMLFVSNVGISYIAASIALVIGVVLSYFGFRK
jgi:hypothetical protein